MALTTVKTGAGVLHGAKTGSGSISIFRGVPYAQPPVGALRFQPPRPVVPWTGVKECRDYSPAPLQERILGYVSPWCACPGGISEDCLYLDLWTPAESPAEKLPVMIFFYGGTFKEGTNCDLDIDGEALSAEGVIVISCNYRVGPMGFLALQGHTSGNMGLLDQIMALRWIQDNIEAFGGDPDNVTVFGQSAGAISIRVLLQSPLCKNLFHHAIIQSGGGVIDADYVRSLEEMQEICQKCLDYLHWEYADIIERDGEEVSTSLSLAAHTLLEGKEPGFFQPCIDHYVLDNVIGEGIAEGNYMDADIICGSNPGDSTMFGRKVVHLFQDNPAALRAFSISPPLSWARKRASEGKKGIYTYYFARTMDAKPVCPFYHLNELPKESNAENRLRDYGLETPHRLENAYIFGTMERIGLNCHAYDRQLSGAMIKYWTNFAKNGDPNGGGLPSWPIYSCEEPLTMVFSDEGFEAVDLIQTEIEDRIVMYSQEHPGFITEIDDVLRNGE